MSNALCRHGFGFVVLACLLPAAAPTQGDEVSRPLRPVGGAAKKPFAGVPTSHEKIADVPVKSTDGKSRLQTLSLDAAGRVLALAAPPKTFGAPLKGLASEVQVFSPEGKPLLTLKVDFH